MQTIKRVGRFLLDTVEIYIPTVAFSIMFVSFVVQVFFRYVVCFPLTWTFELCQMTFLWAGILGACYTLRKNEHVVFGLIYDSLGQRGRCICDIFAGFICVASLGLLVQPTIKYLNQISKRFPATIKVSFAVVFLPFLLMVIISIVRFSLDIFHAMKILAQGPLAKEGGEVV